MRNEIRKAIVGSLWPILKSHGFTYFDGLCAFRFSTHHVDVLEVQFAQNNSYGLSPNSFRLEAGVFFKFAPHPMQAKFESVDGLPLKSVVDCHFRILSKPFFLMKSRRDYSMWNGYLWRLFKNLILSDLTRNVCEYLILWFDKFDDLECVYEYLKIINISGNQDFSKNKDSWGFLYSQKQLEFAFRKHLK